MEAEVSDPFRPTQGRANALIPFSLHVDVTANESELVSTTYSGTCCSREPNLLIVAYVEIEKKNLNIRPISRGPERV